MKEPELFHAESPTGKVHFASDGRFKAKLIAPLCNQRQWRGDYWGKKWPKTDKPVTCKRCLAMAISEGIISGQEARLSPAYPKGYIIRITTTSQSLINIPVAKKDLESLRKQIDEYLSKEKPARLTVGMRCRIKPTSSWYHKDNPGENEALLRERSNSSFSFMRLGQKKLIREDPKTVIGGGAWISENELEFVDADLKANMVFIDWYEEHEQYFCADCHAWFPKQGAIDPETDEDYLCPNEKCPGRLYDSGTCPHCAIPAVNKGKTHNECPECGFEFDL